MDFERYYFDCQRERRTGEDAKAGMDRVTTRERRAMEDNEH